MLKLLENTSKWRLFWILFVLLLLFLDAASYITRSAPLRCIYDENYKNSTYNHDCPTFHVFLIKQSSIVAEKIGAMDTWFIASVLIVIIAFWQIIAWLCEKRRPITWFNALKATDKFSVALVAVGFFQLLTFEKTDRTLRLQQRAWLGPVDAFLAAPMVKGQPISVGIVFENTGKEPALDVFNIAAGYGGGPAYLQTTGPRDEGNFCMGIHPVDGFPAIFPTANRKILAAMQNRVIADDGLIDGWRILIVTGCAAYATLGESHSSSYCFWLGLSTDPTTGLRQFNRCSGSFQAN